MAVLNKIIKNTTGSIVFIPDVGISLDPFAVYDITESELLMWVASTDIIPLVNAGTVIVNNGLIDLPATEGIRYLQYPDRLNVQESGTDITRVVTELNFTGAVTVTDNTDGKVTVDISTSAVVVPALREVTMVQYPFGPVNIESNLLFEPIPENDTILFLKEEIL